MAQQRRFSTARRGTSARRRRLQPYGWLGVGAVAVGVGAALAGGAGVAQADTGAPNPAASTAGHTKPAAGSHIRAEAASTTSGNRAKSLVDAGGARTASFSAEARVSSTANPTQPGAVATRAKYPAEYPGASTVLVPTRPIAPGTVKVSVPATAVAATLKPLAFSAATPATNPIAGLLAAVVSFFGLNTPTAPANPLTGLLWGVFRGINTALGFTPQAGTPTIGTPDPNAGTVTGTWEFTEPAGLDMTYTFTSASNGVVHVYTNGTYSYTPTDTARETATATTTDSFAVIADDGVASTSRTITVPVLPLAADKPVAGTPTVGTPDPTTGIVTGTLGFTDPGGNALTYTFATNPTKGITTVYTDGSYSYSPTEADRLAATPGTTDTFSVTASNGSASATETVTVPVLPLATVTPAGPGTITGVGAYVVAISPGGGRVYTQSDIANGLKAIDTSTNTVSAAITLSDITIGSGVQQIAVNPESGNVYLTVDGGLMVIDPNTNKIVTTVALGPKPSDSSSLIPESVTVGADGGTAYVTTLVARNDGNDTGAIEVINAVDNTLSRTILVSLVPKYSAISPDGSSLYVSTDNGGAFTTVDPEVNTVVKVDIATGAQTSIPLGSLEVGLPKNGDVYDVGPLAVSPDGQFVYALHQAYLPVGTYGAVEAYGAVAVVNTTTNAVTTIPLGLGINPEDIALSPTGSYAYVTSDYAVFVIDTATDAIVDTIPDSHFPKGIAISDAGLAYLGNSEDGSISVVSVPV